MAQAAAPQLRQVFVPATEIPIGTIITPEWLSRMEITENALNGEMILADAAGDEFLAGSVARQVLPQGVPIARSFLVRPGDRGFLAAVLPKGMRAITIPVDAIAGLSGLALPGDRVDLILTYSVSGDAGSGIRASETVISNLRVLAFDQRLGPEAPPKDKEGKAEGAPVAKTATLEVSPRQAEVITLAQTLGTLSLVLNSVRDGGSDKPAKTEAVSLGADRLLLPQGRRGHRRTAPDPRVRRDLDQPGADRARREDRRHGHPQRSLGRPRSDPHRVSPHTRDESSETTSPPRRRAGCCLRDTPRRLAGPARRLRARAA